MHRSRAYLVALLTALLLVTASPVHAAKQADVDEKLDAASEARKKADAAEDRADALAKEAAALDTEISKLQADADKLEPQIDDATSRTERLRNEVVALKRDIEVTRSEIASTTAELDHQQGLLDARVATTYKNGQWYYLSLILGSEDFNDLIARTELVQRVIDANQDLADRLSFARDKLKRDQVQLERDLESVAAKKREAEAVQAELERMQAARQAVVTQQQGVRNQKSSLMAENKANAARLRKFAEQEEAEARRIAAQLAARPKGSGQYAGGAMSFPVPGGYITSSFGYRIHPIFGTRKLHQGVDIGAGSGAAVVAAGDGTVMLTSYGWGGGYGNRIWIDHGNGVVTTYNHLLDGSFSVSNGAKVSRGQRIASVGSTGYSTGPHLHFEVRVNGEAKNPANYF